MESFLASRQTVAKLGSTVKNLTGAVFTPMSAAKPEPPKTGAAGRTGAAPVETSTPQSAKPDDVHAAHPVSVEVVQENGTVSRIVVHCRCGETIELDCLYPE